MEILLGVGRDRHNPPSSPRVPSDPGVTCVLQLGWCWPSICVPQENGAESLECSPPGQGSLVRSR